MMVHPMCKTSDGSDAFTYFKARICMDGSRVYAKALRYRYENASMQENYISETKHILATISYINERAMKLEKFVSQFVKLVDELDK